MSILILQSGAFSGRLATFQTDFFPDINFRIASRNFKALNSRTKIKEFNGDLCRQYQLEGNDAAFLKRFLTQEIQNDLPEYQSATEVRFGMPIGVKFEDADYNRLIETTVKFDERLKINDTDEAEIARDLSRNSIAR